MKLPRFMQVPDTFDPDDRRRRQSLNIILSFFMAAALFSMIATFSYGDPFLDVVRDPDVSLILLSSLSAVVVFPLLFVLNRWERAGSLAGWLFILTVIAVITISDTPRELLGRGLIVWALPILAGGIVLPARAAFTVALIVSIVNSYISIFLLHLSLNPCPMAIYFSLAALTWLGMSIANSAIRAARNEAQKNAAALNGVADGVVVLANPVALSLMGNGLAGSLPRIETWRYVDRPGDLALYGGP